MINLIRRSAEYTYRTITRAELNKLPATVHVQVNVLEPSFRSYRIELTCDVLRLPVQDFGPFEPGFTLLYDFSINTTSTDSTINLTIYKNGEIKRTIYSAHARLVPSSFLVLLNYLPQSMATYDFTSLRNQRVFNVHA